MEKLIKKLKSRTTVDLIKKHTNGKAEGEELNALEIVLVTRGQRNIKLATDPAIIMSHTGLDAEELDLRDYYDFDVVTDSPETGAEVEEKPKKAKAAKKEKKAKEPKKESMTQTEHAILKAIIDNAEDKPVGKPVIVDNLKGIDPELFYNGARLSGAIKTLVRRMLIEYVFTPTLARKMNDESVVKLTKKGLEVFEEGIIKELKMVKKKNKELNEDEIEDLKAEFEDTRKEFVGKFVGFKTNVQGSNEIGLVTGAKIDYRSGYVYLNIRVGVQRFNKRAHKVDIVETIPAWAHAEADYRAKVAEARKKASAKKDKPAPENEVNAINEENEELLA